MICLHFLLDLKIKNCFGNIYFCKLHYQFPFDKLALNSLPYLGEAKVEDEIKHVESSLFDFDTIRIGTNNFSDANKLGQGGFGPVYKVNIALLN